MHKRFKYNLLAILGIVLILFSNCKKDDDVKVDKIIFNPATTYGSVTDVDGNKYKTKAIEQLHLKCMILCIK